jgi:glycosyltransferase involved in cell wall biosynthesis
MSMIAIEAMVCLKPLLLNQNSEVLHYYCQVNDTCFGYSNEEQFVQNLGRIAQHDWSSAESAERLFKTKLWAEKNYSWEAVTNAYIESPNQSTKAGNADAVLGLNSVANP